MCACDFTDGERAVLFEDALVWLDAALRLLAGPLAVWSGCIAAPARISSSCGIPEGFLATAGCPYSKSNPPSSVVSKAMSAAMVGLIQ